MSKKREGAYRRLLEEKKAELLAAQPPREGITIQQRMADVMEEVLLATDRDLAIDALNRAERLLAEIQIALDAIDYGEYGSCARCGQRIPRRRLEAVPWTRLCLHCQEEADEVQIGPTGNRDRLPIRRVA